MKTKIQTPVIIRRVKITGPKDFREIDMLLDTGARYTTLSWDILKDIGYDPARTERKTPIVTANGVIEAPFLRVDSIKIKDVVSKNIEAVALDIPELVGIEGLLGLSFLEKTKTFLDYKNKILEINDP